ncbi:efflux RND transporter periplasmic adaptor subunit [Flavobacteriales bacterium]|nr:efflux RND transporter periplasmic adaptor subunit [Flavobacteriales bacterium]
MKWRPYLLVFLFLLILIVIGIAYYSGKSQGLALERENVAVDTTIIPATDTQVKLKFVNTETVKLQTYASEIEALGRVNSTQAISVMAEVQGILLSGNLPLKKGTSFTKGQVLFGVNSNDASLLIAARKSNFLTLLANILPDIKVDYPNHYEVWNMFFDNIDMERPLPPIPPLVSAKLKTLLATRNVLSEYYSIRADQVRLSKYTITAPFSGTIVDAFTDVGAIVNPGSPVINIINNSALEVECQVKMDEAKLVKIGAKTILTDDQDNSWLGKVRRKGQYLNPNTQSVPVFVELVSTENEVFNGMYLLSSIDGDSIPNVFEIPRSALLGNSAEVYVVRDSILIRQNVDVVLLRGEKALIGGVDSGEAIVIEPLVNPKDNMKVATIEK